MPAEKDSLLSGRYELGELIASGNMSDVFLARDKQLNRRVAVKILAQQLADNPEFIRRFRHEAQAAAGLNHSNIVSVYDQGNEGNTYYIVMEYVDGKSLADYLANNPQMDPALAVSIILKIAATLDFAHASGIVHRDIKPGNILITPENEIKVADFGIAHISNANSIYTKTDFILGTAAYFSPEQALDEKVDARSDIYSLGVVFYQTLTGRVPFGGSSASAIAQKHINSQPPEPDKRVQPELAAVALKMLEKNPQNRFQSGKDLIKILSKIKVMPQQRTAPEDGQENSSNEDNQEKSSKSQNAAGSFSGKDKKEGGKGTGVSSWLSRFFSDMPGKIEKLLDWFRNKDAFKRLEFLKGNSQLRAFTWSFILLGLAILLLVPIYLIGITDSTSASGRIEVVSVYRSNEEDAVRVLTDRGLDVIVEKSVNIQVARGLVYEQNPRPGAKLNEGDSITIFISEGAEARAVPQVVGQEQADAERVLTSSNFGFKTQIELVEDPATEGVVVNQNPEPGEKREPGDTVILFVSLGIERVPDLRNYTEERALRVLNGLDYEVEVERVPDNDLPENYVINTSPANDLPAPENSRTITLLVSSGPPIITELELSNVIGLTQSRARFQLEDLGFVVDVGYRIAAPGQGGGIVVGQIPAAGIIVPYRATIRIIVSQ